MVLWGAYQSIATVFDAADAAMGLMATINLIAIVALSGLVVKLTRDYFEQRRHGTPRFDPAKYPELAGQISTDVWGSDARSKS
jgi:AGCS family alanine or glycine:cation symporter